MNHCLLTEVENLREILSTGKGTHRKRNKGSGVYVNTKCNVVSVHQLRRKTRGGSGFKTI
jgi:hypothetical protein